MFQVFKCTNRNKKYIFIVAEDAQKAKDYTLKIKRVKKIEHAIVEEGNFSNGNKLIETLLKTILEKNVYGTLAKEINQKLVKGEPLSLCRIILYSHDNKKFLVSPDIKNGVIEGSDSIFYSYDDFHKKVRYDKIFKT